MTTPTCGQCEYWTAFYYDEGACEIMPRAPGGVVMPVLSCRASCRNFIPDMLDGRAGMGIIQPSEPGSWMD